MRGVEGRLPHDLQRSAVHHVLAGQDAEQRGLARTVGPQEESA